MKGIFRNKLHTHIYTNTYIVSLLFHTNKISDGVSKVKYRMPIIKEELFRDKNGIQKKFTGKRNQRDFT